MSLLPLRVVRTGIAPWRTVLDLQHKFVKELQEDDKAADVLILCEHPPVYTLGKRLEENPAEARRLTAIGAEYHKTTRGGQITFHGLGQLVGYPIMRLNRYNHSIKIFVDMLEGSIMRSLEHWNIASEQSVHTGVWVGHSKIAALGLQVGHGVTHHGFAINCNVDLSWFAHIVPCGIADRGVTSISRVIGRDVAVNEAIPVVLREFCTMYGCSPHDHPVALPPLPAPPLFAPLTAPSIVSPLLPPLRPAS